MFKMMLVLFPVIATTLMGIAVIAILGIDMWAGPREIALSAAAGFVLSIPISWWVGKQVIAKTGWDS